MEPIISERRLYVCSGAPTEVSRKGKAPPIPFPIEPDRVAAEAFERRNNGFDITGVTLPINVVVRSRVTLELNPSLN